MAGEVATREEEDTVSPAESTWRSTCNIYICNVKIFKIISNTIAANQITCTTNHRKLNHFFLKASLASFLFGLKSCLRLAFSREREVISPWMMGASAPWPPEWISNDCSEKE